MTKFKIISLSIIILLAACGDVTPTEIRKEDVLSENFRDAYRALEPINILGQSYMVSDIRHYPVLNMWCNDGDKKTFIDIELRPGWEGERRRHCLFKFSPNWGNRHDCSHREILGSRHSLF